jgi:DNA mismatch repair protein MutS
VTHQAAADSFTATSGISRMTFHSILFERPEDSLTKEIAQAPAFFLDLNLDQIVEAITAGKEEYNLKPFFYRSLRHVETIQYRHEITQDLENEILFEHIRSFAQSMRTMREHLAQEKKRYYKYQKDSWFLDAVEIYCHTVNCLAQNLTLTDLKSRGFLAFREYLKLYTASDRFVSLLSETRKLRADLSAIRYCVLIKNYGIKVRKYESETDYSAAVEETFAKFKQGAVKDHPVKFSNLADMNHVEAKILDFVAQLHPEIFLSLDSYCLNNRDYLDDALSVFDREIQFYFSYLEYLAGFKRAGLHFCYPDITDTDKEICAREGFDLALANKLITEKAPLVCNDFYLKDQERIFVVSGPNQGGKTTFARTFGQLHYLASIGCPVPGREARLFLFDKLYTHFEKEEDLQNLRGKLQDDLVRIYSILNDITPQSIIIMNESFTSTTLQDAIFLSKRVMAKIIQLDLLCVCVTFIDELASLSAKTVSMVSTVVPKNPASRTFKIVRRPADGLSYAISIAERHRVTYDSIRERIQS